MINVIVSGYFNPVGEHHIYYIDNAILEGQKLTYAAFEKVQLHIIVNNDNQVKLKGSCPFMSQYERYAIMKRLYPQAKVRISEAFSESVALDIAEILFCHQARKTIFCNGGDKSKIESANSREIEVCNDFNIKMVFGVGGTAKNGSSSNMIEKAAKWWVANKMELSKN